MATENCNNGMRHGLSFSPFNVRWLLLNKRKLTPEEKHRKEERKAAFMTIFINGRQKRVRRPRLIDGMSVDEFLVRGEETTFMARNAEPLWLHQHELWELYETPETPRKDAHGQATEEIPF